MKDNDQQALHKRQRRPSRPLMPRTAGNVIAYMDIIAEGKSPEVDD